MNYLILKNIIETTVTNFRCQACGGTIEEKDVNLLGTAANAVNMEVTCPHCNANGVVKAEVNTMQSGAGFSPEFLNQIRTLIEHVGHSHAPQHAIKDSDIVSLREMLKSSNSMEELFRNA